MSIGKGLSLGLVRHQVYHWVTDEWHTRFDLGSHRLEGRVDFVWLHNSLVHLREDGMFDWWLVVITEPHQVRHRLGCE
jgi:hypothetical protein